MIRRLAFVAFLIAAPIVPAGLGTVGVACAAGELHVAVIVDFGNNASVSSTCVAAGDHDNGAQALVTRAKMLGTSAPRFAASGLLCAIDDVPATGCGEQHGGNYAYWSYFHGTGGTWTYSNIGPASLRVHADIVEGWRWQPAGAGNPTDPPPRAAADAALVCKPSAPPTTVPHPVTTVPSVGVVGTTTPRVGGGAPSTATAPASRASAKTTLPKQRDSNASESSTTVRTPFVGTASAARPSTHHDASPVGLIVGIVLVCALGAAGVVIARRRAAKGMT